MLFVLTKDIRDKILITHKILSFFLQKHNNKGYITIKFDIEKACDRLS